MADVADVADASRVQWNSPRGSCGLRWEIMSSSLLIPIHIPPPPPPTDLHTRTQHRPLCVPLRAWWGLCASIYRPPTPNMAGEDFAFFLRRKPGAFFFVGSNPDAAFALDPAMYECEPCLFSS